MNLKKIQILTEIKTLHFYVHVGLIFFFMGSQVSCCVTLTKTVFLICHLNLAF